MPALIGGFGKIKVHMQTFTSLPTLGERSYALAMPGRKGASRAISISSGNGYGSGYENKLEFLRNKYGHYLAGLIEADGSLAVHDINSNAKRYLPKILIVFSLNDIPLVEKLISIIEVGKMYKKEKQGCVIWHIQNIEDVIKIIQIINGKMRTPKIEALHRAINWYNSNKGTNIEPLGLDLSPIDSNAWLAGFSDGDANFSINLTDRKKKGIIMIDSIPSILFLPFFPPPPSLKITNDYALTINIDMN